jgi:hypothetical protein
VTTYKVGDHIRATLGNNTNEGIVQSVHESGTLYIEIDGTSENWVQLEPVWTITLIQPALPETIGTVLRDNDGDLWVRRGTCWQCLLANLTCDPESFIETYGPVTVLYEGPT